MGQWDRDAEGVVEFPNGVRVRGRGMRSATMPAGQLPDFGVYLLAKAPRIAWDHEWIQWPDFWVPRSSVLAVATLQRCFSRSVGERVEVACAGGKGRTGSALALMAVMAGVPPGEAVGWVRERYRAGAVEMPWQRWWVVKNAALIDR